jgi:GDP-L-fucose synthase
MRPAPPSLAGRRVLVTGGAGFLGQAVLARLAREGCAAVDAPRHEDVDLRDAVAAERRFLGSRPDVVIHLAARVGGIGANQRHPAVFWRDNLQMGVNVLEASRLAEVGRLVVVGTVCAYPKHTPVPFREAELWNGYPEETNAPYGVAKRALAVGLDAYRREFGLRSAFLLPANLYGPGDDFDPETSHVIAAMIRKCVEAVDAGSPAVRLWGTGAPTREFLFVRDAAEGVVRAAAAIDDPAPMNLGTGREVAMRDLARLVAAAAGFSGRFEWDPSRPDGQPRRALDVSAAASRLGWSAATSLEEGLRETVAWYRAHRATEGGCASSS